MNSEFFVSKYVVFYSDTRVKNIGLLPGSYVGTDNILQDKRVKVHYDFVLYGDFSTEYKKDDALISNIRFYMLINPKLKQRKN
jgi:hypothetical protein